MDGKELLGLYWARSERALAETIARYGRRCHTVAYRIFHSREDSEECVSNACLHAWESIPVRELPSLSVHAHPQCGSAPL